MPVHRRLLAGARDLESAVLLRLLEQVPAYRTLPSEQLRGEILKQVARGIAAFAGMLRTGEPLGEDEQAAIRESAARRADEGVPIESVVGAYHVGAEECAARVLSTAEPMDHADVLLVQHRLLGFLRQVSSAVAAGYVEERQSALGDEQVALQSLLSRLLEGGSPQAAADRAGVQLPPSYLVLSVAMGPHPDELLPGVNRPVVVRRKLRRLRNELQRHTTGVPLSVLSGDGGLVLIPYGTPAADFGEADRERLAWLVGQFGRMCGAELLVAATAAPPEGVAEAARLASEIREAAESSGRPPGLYLLDDVLLAYQLSRPGPARDRLAALLGPLDDRPELLDTLRTFLACGLDRRLAATRLQVHRNTVDYRLRKAADLTGLDAARGADLLTLQAALAAHDARRRDAFASGQPLARPSRPSAPVAQ
ncbi:helix-turn-helix domain-containing protein [Streptomyces roseicoloratus]|uniref:Helix-turn-helix domain-containing protein n=1 Tax=Streptomyces roseicoloratus TaxID=2508722 RepID=A0ABY9S3E8_9ACTN|nr:helix-turn-helix domain-containing protein [Streptomyces roseicoloratus]WMX48544.1 helix-turn-helix domain-containing protein [Streptomyces roseicoloratus]